MKTKIPNPKSPTPPDPVCGKIDTVRTNLIAPSPFQARKLFDPAELAELQASIKDHGIRIPLLGRSRNGKIELIAGERRWRCAVALKLPTVPMLLAAVTDADAITIQRIENAQRAGLTAMETAEDYLALQQKGYSVESLQRLFSKQRSHIYTRLRVARLPEQIKGLVRGGRIIITIADELAKLPTATLQLQALKEIENHFYGDEPFSYRSTRDYLRRHFQFDLGKASFDVKLAYALEKPKDPQTAQHPGPCADCPWRSGNCRELYPDLKSPNDCTNPECYAAKTAAHATALTAAAKAKGRTVLTGEEAKQVFAYGHLSGNYTDTLESRCYSDPKDRTYRKLLGGQAPPATVAVDPQGRAVQVWHKRTLDAAVAAAGHKFAQKAKADTEKKKADQATGAAKDELRQQTMQAVLPQVLAKVEKIGAKLEQQLPLLRWLLAIVEGSYWRQGIVKPITKLKLGPAWKQIVDWLLDQEETIPDTDGEYPEEFAALCRLTGINLKLAEKARAKMPVKTPPVAPARKGRKN